MTLINRLTTEMKEAMKARDKQRRDALRLLISGLQNVQKDKGSDLEPQEEMDFLTREAKRRQDSIDAYRKAERQDLLDIEQYELDLITVYLPEQLSAEEAKAIVAEIVAEIGATSRKQMGLVMKASMPKLKGRFPGKDVKGIVEALLS